MASLQSFHYQRDKTPLYCHRLPGSEPRSTLVLLHGLASNGTRWKEFCQRMDNRRNWEILCPDLRGHGRSTVRGRLTDRDWTDDLVSLLDAAGCERAVVGGHCMGAGIAIRFALRHPDRVRGLVLVEPMLQQALRGMSARIRPVRWLFPALAMPVRGLNAIGFHRGKLPVLDLSELDRQTRKLMAESEDHSAMLKRYGAPTKDLRFVPTAIYLKALYLSLGEAGPLDELKAPALALLSGGSLMADPDQSRRLLQVMPDVRIKQIDALHWIPTEQPEALVHEVGVFLDGLAE